MKTTIVEFDEFAGIDFQDPSTYYVRTALYYVYIHCETRKRAVEWVKENYDGKYSVRASKNVVGTPHYESHNITARG